MKKRVVGLLIIAALVFSGTTVTFADNMYTVKIGDVLWKIAKQYNVTWQELAKTNQLINPNLIYPGQILSFVGQDTDSKSIVDGNAKNRDVNKGEVYEFISEKVLIPSRGIKIPATFVYPKTVGDKKFPLVVMAHGHAGNRDEAGGFTRVAEGLATKGIASIRMDFPGCGESSEPFTQNNLTNMLSDIKGSLDFAIAKSIIDEENIGILGYSMGGRLAIMSVEKDSRYKLLALWAPVGTNGAEPIMNFMGGREAYNDMNKKAEEKGTVLFTTRWGQKQNLSKKWFDDMNAAKTLDIVESFTGPILVVYGDKDDVIYPELSKTIFKAAVKSSKVVEHVVLGADHGFGMYNNDLVIFNETMNVTIDFLTTQLR